MTLATSKLAALGLPVLGSFAGGSLYGWSGYAASVRASFDLSHSTTAMIFSLALVSFTLGVLAGPVLISRIPARRQLATISAAAALCLVLSGYGPSLGVFLLGYGLGFGFMSGVVYNYAIVQMSQTDRPALLVPISVAAFGLGGAAFGASSVALNQLGFGLWSHAPALGCLVLVVVGAIVFGHGAQASPKPVESVFFWPNREIMVLWLVFAVGSLPGLIILGMATYFVPQGAQAAWLAGFAVVLAAVGNTMGRLAASLIAPRYGPYRGVVLALSLSAVSLLALLATTSPAAVLVALFLVALAYGHLAANMPLLVKSRVSAQAFPTAFGWVFTGWGFAGLVGPWGSGWLFDQTGSFTIALGVCFTLVLMGLATAYRAVPRSSPAKAKQPASVREG